MGNEVSAEQEAPAAPDPPPLTGTVPVCLLWPHGGKTAYICGSFTQWQKMPMQWRQTPTGGEWTKARLARAAPRHMPALPAPVTRVRADTPRPAAARRW